MTDKTKDRIVAAGFSVIASIVVFALSFWVTGLADSDKTINLKLESKVDKAQYRLDCDAAEKKIVAIETTMKEYVETNRELMKLLYEMNIKLGRIETDVTWLKQRIK
jgi:hypothetical protein